MAWACRWSERRSVQGLFRLATLPELFPVSFPGVKTSRDGFLVDTDLNRLKARINDYFNADLSHEEIARRYPGVMKTTAAVQRPRSVRHSAHTRGGPDEAELSSVSPIGLSIIAGCIGKGDSEAAGSRSGLIIGHMCLRGECLAVCGAHRSHVGIGRLPKRALHIGCLDPTWIVAALACFPLGYVTTASEPMGTARNAVLTCRLRHSGI